MNKLDKKWKLILYGCAGLGVNMLNIVMGTYLCSAIIVGGFTKEDIGFMTYGNKDLVIAGIWGILVLVAKIFDGIIDIPLSHFTDNLKTKWGRRRPSIVIGFVPMIIAYLLFLFPLNNGPTILNTIWFAVLLTIFYGSYTLTMLTYYATFAEIVQEEKDIALISNVKSICDVVYFALGFALIPVFVNSVNLNIRVVALIFLPLSLTMLIPLFLIKEKRTDIKTNSSKAAKGPSLIESISFAFKSKEFILWLCVLCTMNVGLQLFLSGINEYFSTTGLNMTFVMGSCFVPVPFTILLYNKITKKFGLGVSYKYALGIFSIAMILMLFCNKIPQNILLPFAMACGVIVSFSIGAFFSVTYSVPSHIASFKGKDQKHSSAMFFAVQGLFEGASAGIGSGIILTFLKDKNDGQYITYIPLIVAVTCMAAFLISFFLPGSVKRIGKIASERKK